MPRLFAIAIFSSATLLFVVQPLVGKMVLPVLGGSPAVWSICLVFFQAMLLLGYLYAHALSSYVPWRWQLPVHVAFLAVAGLGLLGGVEFERPNGSAQRWWLLQALTADIGLPFLALSASAPLLQRWYSRTTAPSADDPYFLYAASNAGSLLGLLGYLFMEPMATRSAQLTGWVAMFWTAAALVAACGYAALRTQSADTRHAATRAAGVSASRIALWIVLALVPSALLSGVTQHLATDVVSVPLMWIVPLSLYLFTYIGAFSKRRVGSARLWGRLAPAAALIVLVLLLADVRYPIALIVVSHLAAFGVLAMMCHTHLAATRPEPALLTTYFVSISLGGMLGGAVVALLAPAIFSSILEYPLAVGAALFLRPQSIGADQTAPPSRWGWRMTAALLYAGGAWIAAPERSLELIPALSLVIPAVLLLLFSRTAVLFAGATAGLLAGASMVRTDGQLLLRERTFFGVHEVTSVENGAWHVLTHGTTTHGVQAMVGKLAVLPTAYYHPSGPIGDLVFTLAPDGRLHDVAVVGLGVGALAAYAGKGVRMDFFEIDRAVVRIAEDPRLFRYVSEARKRPEVTVRIITADGRIGLAAAPPSSYDLIVIDAFSSDAIPTHLVTREALAIYMSRLKPRGVVAFHISSRYFDLTPVLANVAADQGWVCYARIDAPISAERRVEGMRASQWVVLARRDADLGQVSRFAPRWTKRAPTGDRVWTDDYTNVLGVLQK